jgi:ribosomal protein S5
VVTATMNGLRALRNVDEMAAIRGKRIDEIIG